MDNHFLRLTDTKSLDDLLRRSEDGPVIIFKHSTTCPISAAAYREMEQVERDVNLIEVQIAGKVSREIENRIGVPHESPQVIVLRRGTAVWNASHWKVKADAIEQVIRENS